MTVSELRTLVDNLDEYIHVPGGIDRLKKMVLHLAVSGQLVSQDPSEGTGEELYRQIQAEKAELVKQGKLKKQKVLPEISDDEVLFAIPESWKWVRLGSLAAVISKGTTPAGGKNAYCDDGVGFVRAENVAGSKFIDVANLKYVTEEQNSGLLSRSKLHSYDLLICIAGTLGRTSLVPPTRLSLNCNQAVSFTRFVNMDLLSTLYFQQVIMSSEIQKQLLATVKTTAIPNLTLEIISNCIVPLPSKAEQDRIVAKVDSILGLIDQLAEAYESEQAERSRFVTTSLAQLAKSEIGASDSLALTHLPEIICTKADAKILRQTILHLAVSGQLVPQDPSEGTGEELYQQIQDEKAELVKQGKIKKHPALSEVGDEEIPHEIPSNWKWVRQADIFDITSSKRVMQSDWKKSGIPFLRARDLTAAIKTNEISSDIFVSQDYFDSVKKISGVPQPGDLMVSGVGTIGTPYIVKDGDEFYFKDATILWFKNFSNVSSKFMKQVLLSSYMKKKVKSQSQGTTVDTYTIANARMNIVPLPPFAEQKRIVAKTTQLLDLVSELEKHLEK